MRTVLWTAPAVALVLTLAAMRCLAPLARRIGLVDRPDGARKDHRETVPLIGGLAIIVGVLTASLFPSVRAGAGRRAIFILSCCSFFLASGPGTIYTSRVRACGFSSNLGSCWSRSSLPDRDP